MNDLFENSHEEYGEVERDVLGEIIYRLPTLHKICLIEEARYEQRLKVQQERESESNHVGIMNMRSWSKKYMELNMELLSVITYLMDQLFFNVNVLPMLLQIIEMTHYSI